MKVFDVKNPAGFTARYVCTGKCADTGGFIFADPMMHNGEDTFVLHPGVSDKQGWVWSQVRNYRGDFMALLRPSRVKPFLRKTESDHKHDLWSQVGGVREVPTPFGNIDLLTDTVLYEVKLASNWKSALGQLLAYGEFYPRHTKVLVVFGCISFDTERIRTFLSKFDVKLHILD